MKQRWALQSHRRFHPPGKALSGALLLCGALTAIADPITDEKQHSLDAAARELASYQQALDDAIAEGGPYSPILAETYQGFGRHLQQYGQHESALVMLRKAQHLQRIHHGIHGTGQIPALRAMVDSYQATGQLEATTNAHRELLRLAGHSLQTDAPAHVSVLREAARWHLSAHLLDSDELRIAHLQAAHDLLEQAWTIADPQATDVATRAALLRDRALLQFHMLRDRAHNRHNPAPQATAGYRSGSDLPGIAIRAPSASIGQGRELLAAQLALWETEAPTATAERERARLDLADWDLLFGKVDPALQLYQRLFTEADVAAMAEPLPLPAARGDGEPQLSAQIRLDISAKGVPDRIELLDSTPFADPKQRQRILRAVQETRFRPVFADGAPVASTGAIIAFPLVD